MKRYAIIVAGGIGARMNSETPKQFLRLNGLPVIMYSLKQFYKAGAELVVVIHPSYIDLWSSLCSHHNINIPHATAAGGSTRTHSVRNGLAAIAASNGLVAIHDAARPLISLKQIETMYNETHLNGNAIPFLTVNESMRQRLGADSKPVNRDEYITIQTPQCFNLNLLKDVYSKVADESFTDDATLFESFNHRLNFVLGERINFKITQLEDLRTAEAIIKQMVI